MSYFDETSLLAPEFLGKNLPTYWSWIKWIELFTGLGLILGIFTRYFAFLLLLIIFLIFFYFGIEILQYSGFYLGIIYYLLIEGSGKYAILPDANHLSTSSYQSLLVLQMLTGINFIYSAITMKYYYPNLDIAILKMNDLITFGLSYSLFVYLMLITEIIFGILIILGYRLRIVSQQMVL